VGYRYAASPRWLTRGGSWLAKPEEKGLMQVRPGAVSTSGRSWPLGVTENLGRVGKSVGTVGTDGCFTTCLAGVGGSGWGTLSGIARWTGDGSVPGFEREKKGIDGAGVQ
jgi:hypothetical protein